MLAKILPRLLCVVDGCNGFGCRRAPLTADRHPIFWLWFSEMTLGRLAAFRCITDAHAVSFLDS
jgi:hypothetical protein